jgi:hypothetical protein
VVPSRTGFNVQIAMNTVAFAAISGCGRQRTDAYRRGDVVPGLWHGGCGPWLMTFSRLAVKTCLYVGWHLDVLSGYGRMTFV